MRTPLLTLIVAAVLLALALAGAGTADAAATPGRAAAPAVLAQRQVNQHDGSRVAVQLAVLGGAAVVVVIIGTGAYFLRRKLGLTAPPPKQPGDAHH